MGRKDFAGRCVFANASHLPYFQSETVPLILPGFLKAQTTAAALSQRMVYESL